MSEDDCPDPNMYCKANGCGSNTLVTESCCRRIKGRSHSGGSEDEDEDEEPLLLWPPADMEDDEEDEEVIATTKAPAGSCSPRNTGRKAWACCSRNNQCGHGEGDCDSNQDCKEGHFCGNNNCKTLVDNLTSKSATMDCCELRATSVPATTAAVTPKDSCFGGDDCCRPENQCGEGHGDCDNDNDCLGGLVCKVESCDRSTYDTFDSTDDCCQFPEDPETTTGPTITPKTTADPHPGFTTSIRPFTIESTTTTTIREYEEKGKYTACIATYIYQTKIWDEGEGRLHSGIIRKL